MSKSLRTRLAAALKQTFRLLFIARYDLVFDVTSNPPEDPIEWVSYILATVRDTLHEHPLKDRAHAALLAYAFDRLLRMQTAFNRMARRALAGAAPRKRAPAVRTKNQGETEPPARKRPAFWLRRARGWMLRMVPGHHLPGAALALGRMCADPATAALLAAWPALANMLRALHVMLSPEACPPEIRRPHDPARIRQRPAAPTLPTPAQFERALRRGKPYPDVVQAYGRIMTYEQYRRERDRDWALPQKT